MSTATRLADIMQDRKEAGHPVQALVLSPRVLRDLKVELGPWCIYPVSGPDDLQFMGVPVRCKRLTAFCAGCGAPAEPGPCSYCKRDPDEIEVQ